MVTFLRPHRHAHGPAFCLHFTPRRSKRQLQHPHNSLPLRPMAQDPSHPHKHKDDAPQQGEQQPPQPPHEEASTSSSSSSDDAASWLQLGLGPSPSSSKRRRTDEGPSTSILPPPGPPPPQQLSLFPGPSAVPPAAATRSTAVVAAAPPPPAHEAGMWFMLRAAQNQAEPSLPQIPRSYLRIRDGRMTVRVVMRYLANKLGLEDESQVEITCRGQRLPPVMMLQHVRDTIWRPAEEAAAAPAVLSIPGSPSTSHLMTLHYGRRT